MGLVDMRDKTRLIDERNKKWLRIWYPNKEALRNNFHEGLLVATCMKFGSKKNRLGKYRSGMYLTTSVLNELHSHHSYQKLQPEQP